MGRRVATRARRPNVRRALLRYALVVLVLIVLGVLVNWALGSFERDNPPCADNRDGRGYLLPCHD